MKSSGILFLTITTLILVALAIFSYLGFSFSLIYYLMLVGQAFLIFSVYKVLTDDYTTNKTFDDFYEDHSFDHDEY